MERVGFLLEDTGERLVCLLNPESLVLKRRAGIARRHTAGGLMAGAELADDPLLSTGGGVTELHLDLLFDVGIAGSSMQTEDVRELTHPLWQLAENSRQGAGFTRVPSVNFIWGRTWNIPGVVAAVAERLEYFTANGIPRRSWMRMKMLRTFEPTSAREVERSRPLPSMEELDVAADDSNTVVHEVGGGVPTAAGEGSQERLDQLAHRYYGDPSFWRVLAGFNDVDRPDRLEAGQLMSVPPVPAGKGS